MWTEKLVEQYKQEIKEELDQEESLSGANARDQLIQSRIKELQNCADPLEFLRLYIYLVSSLVHHIRYKTLSQQRIKQTIHLATNILISQGIKENVSRLSYLHGELHVVYSQIEWQNGEHWKAAWHQYLGYQVTRGTTPGGEGFQYLSLGNRALRLGHVASALEDYRIALDKLSGTLLEKCKINFVRAMRLHGDRQESLRLIQSYQKVSDISPGFARELSWESLVHEYLESGDLNPMLASIRKGRPHYATSYIIEFCLWALISPSKQWLDRAPSLENMKRKKDIKPERGDVYYEVTKTIWDCYDYQIPINKRLTALGEKLSKLNNLVNVDKELLAWAAASRWLIRSRNQTLTRLTMTEYRSLCQRLSSGGSDDLFSCFGDYGSEEKKNSEEDHEGER